MPDKPAAPAFITPYARSLGITQHSVEEGAPVLAIEFGPIIEGRPGALHGGAISGLLETAGYSALRARLDAEDRHPKFKPINITVQFLSTGKQKTSYAKGRITRLGRRSANLTVESWQDDRERPIATAVMNIMLSDGGS